MTATMELPRISIKTEVTKAVARPFVGKVVSDALQPAKYRQDTHPYQWTLAVEPLKSLDGKAGFQIGGKTGAFWEYVPVPKAAIEGGEINEQSKFARHLNAFKKVFGTDDDRAIARGEYLNEVAWFIKDTIEYGTDKTTGEQIKGTILVPVRAMTPEDMVQYGLAAGTATLTEGMAFTPDDLALLTQTLDGIDRNALQKTAYRSKVLSSSLRSAVGKGDGPAITALIDQGLAAFDGDVLRAA